MLIKRTFRNTEGTKVVRVSLNEQWNEYMVAVYEHHHLVSTHYFESEAEAVTAASQEAMLQSVTSPKELSLVPVV